MCVLFTSVRPLYRAENLKAVYDAYDGEKQFVQRLNGVPIDGINSGKYSLLVTDGLIEESPGKYIFISHGMGAGKTVGLQHPTNPFAGSDLITYAIASSEEMVSHVASFCGIPESKVVPVGMPRTDAYFHTEDIQNPYWFSGRNCLYAPTFRTGGWHPDWNRISNAMTDGLMFNVKAHMITQRLMPYDRYYSGIVEYSAEEPSTPYLVNTDVLVTDYSSIMFDAMILRKPTVLFAKDKERYLSVRGMYCKYPDGYSRYFCETEEELVEMMAEAEWSDHDEELRQYHAGACDGHSVERTIDLIRSVL